MVRSALAALMILAVAGCLDPSAQDAASAPEPRSVPDGMPDPARSPEATENQTSQGSPSDDAEEGAGEHGSEEDGSEGDPSPDSEGGDPPNGTPMAPGLVNRSNVVVATFDTGTNPFHPCFRVPAADASKAGIPAFPGDSRPLHLTFAEDYETSLEASQDSLDSIEPEVLHHVVGTRLLFYGQPSEFVDDYPHGAQASSQIGCPEYGLAPEAWLVVLNWYDDTSDRYAYMEWVAAQDWIDIVHLNIQDIPIPAETTATGPIRAMIESGKMVVIAAGNGVAGNGVNYPMELSSYNGPPGSLIAGANDNDGYTTYTNLNPHVVMDGCGTPAAAPDSFQETTFSGTSSASPRTTGYVARLLLETRSAFADTLVDGPGLVDISDPEGRPGSGPLADGSLTVAELHEVVRKTADANPHASWMDGSGCVAIPQPTDYPYAFYLKMGYGEVSEHTMPMALAVLLGEAPMPERSMEDMFYAQSTAFREAYWG